MKLPVPLANYDGPFQKFNIKTFVDIFQSLLSSKKIIFTSKSDTKCGKAVVFAREFMLKPCELNWPHLISSHVKQSDKLLVAPGLSILGIQANELKACQGILNKASEAKMSAGSVATKMTNSRNIYIIDLDMGTIKNNLNEPIELLNPCFFEDHARL